MKIGISAFAWTAHFQAKHLALLPEMREAGLDAIEIPMFDPADLPIDSLRQAFSTHQLDCTVCAILPRGVNPISPDRAEREQAIEHLKRCIQAASRMGAKLLGGPLFAPVGYLPGHRATEQEWSWAIEAFRALASSLHDTGLLLSIEPVNRSETFFLRTADEAVRLCDAIGDPRIGVTIDTFHANIEEPSIPRAIDTLGARLFHLHASENDRGPLGRGHIPFGQIVSALQRIQYSGYLMIEGFGYRKDEIEGPGYLWAHPDVSPEALATESLAHLRWLMDTEPS